MSVAYLNEERYCPVCSKTMPPEDPPGTMCRDCWYRRRAPRGSRIEPSVAPALVTKDAKQQARMLLARAVAAGTVTKPAQCSECTETYNLHGHHPDYAKPLDVVWLCPACHNRLHNALPGKCRRCGAALAKSETGRRRVFCSDVCRQAAHRKGSA